MTSEKHEKLPPLERMNALQFDLTSVQMKVPKIDLKGDLSERRYSVEAGRTITGLLLRQQTSIVSSINDLFVSMMRSLVLCRLAELPERPYPAARLMVCDRISYNYLTKLQYISTMRDSNIEVLEGKQKYSIHRAPFNVTAVFLIEEVTRRIDDAEKPFVRLRHDQSDGRTVAIYEYSVIKKTFPYLRISDLVIVLCNGSNLRLFTFDVSAPREHQVLQCLSHYARTSIFIDLAPIARQVGNQHIFFDNLCIFNPMSSKPPDSSRSQPISRTETIRSDNTEDRAANRPRGKTLELSNNIHMKLPLVHLSFFAYRVLHLSQVLSLHLRSIHFRADDPNNFTKLFTQIVTSGLQSSGANIMKQAHREARVLVLDRFVDLQAVWRHTELYGPFCEQELLLPVVKPDKPDRKQSIGELDKYQTSVNLLRNRLSHALHNTSELDPQLHLEKVNNVLSSIVRYTMEIKPRNIDLRRFINGKNMMKNRLDMSEPKLLPASVSSIIHSHQAMHKHLQLIKIVHEQLDAGYLLIIKIESKAIELTREMTNIMKEKREPLGSEGKSEILERLKRILAAYMQLSKLVHDKGLQAGRPRIRLDDLVRLVCTLLDLINVCAATFTGNSSTGKKSRRKLENDPLGPKPIVSTSLSDWNSPILRSLSERMKSRSEKANKDEYLDQLQEMRMTLLNGDEFVHLTPQQEQKEVELSSVFARLQRSALRGLRYCAPFAGEDLIVTKSNARTKSKIKSNKFRTPNQAQWPMTFGDSVDKNLNSKHASLAQKLAELNRISLRTCEYRSKLSVCDTVEKFCLEQLSEKDYPIFNPNVPQSQNRKRASKQTQVPPEEAPKECNKANVCIVVFLGSLSYDELGKLKLLESRLKTKHPNKVTELIILVSSLVRPGDVIDSL